MAEARQKEIKVSITVVATNTLTAGRLTLGWMKTFKRKQKSLILRI